MNETITRDIQVGSKLVGIRINALTIETHEESQALMSDYGRDWFKRNVHFRVVIPVVEKESNWGSDWVDDGV